MRCPACGHDNPEGARFCNGCGRALTARCGSCGTENPPGARFCNQCGAQLQGSGCRAQGSGAAGPRTPNPEPRRYTPKHLADKILQSKGVLEGERKQVTVLFADVKGSMELAEQLDAEAFSQIMQRFFRILSDGVERFEGFVDKFTGDGIMALYGAPIAHEDHAQRACYAALHLRDAVREYANEVRAQHGVPFAVRVGLNSGDVVVGNIGDDLRMDYTAQGHVVGLAQRMEALAEPGHICLSENTARLVKGYFELQDLGKTKVKGVSQPVPLFDLEGVGPFRTRLDRSRARGLSTFVGRDQEIGLLQAALEHALAGRGRIIGVVADAGVGKSRLCFEFTERCRERGISVYEAHCPAHGKTVAHLPVLELLRTYFGLADGDSARAAREKIAGRLLLLDHAFAPVLPLVWDFLRVPDPERPVQEPDPAERQRQLHEFVRRLVRTRSEREPAVILLDDLHWIDAASDEFLARLVEAVRGTRTLLLVNFRPEYRASWMQRSDYQQLPLTPLGGAAIRALVEHLLGCDPSVAELPAVIEARTAGNPFFTEEIISALIDAEQLVGSRGAYLLVGTADRIEIPPTVHAVLAARIDRLAEREKRVLQMAGIIGKNFAQPLLAQVVSAHDRTSFTGADLDSSLRMLCDLDFLFQRALYPVAEYAFKHPLTHEVAYTSQLQERRRAVHAALARVLEEGSEAPALIAHHWDEAGEVEPAAHWHREAATAAGLVDLQESLRHWKRAHGLVDELPETEATWALASEACSQILFIETRLPRMGEKEVHQLFEQACDLAARSGDPRALPRAHMTYANYLIYRRQIREGISWGERAVTAADRLGDRDLQVATRYALGIGSYYSGELERTIELCTAALELCAGDPGVGTQSMALSPYLLFRGMRCATYALTGRQAEARADAERMYDPAARAHQYSFNIASCFQLYLHWLAGEPRTGLATVRRGIEAAEAAANPAAMVACLSMLGTALALVEEWDEAHEALARSLGMSRAHSAFLQQEAESLTWLGRVEAERGDLERARAALDEAQSVADRIGTRMPLALLHFARARILWHARSADAGNEIQAELQLALTHANEVGQKLYVPFIHLEWAALCRALGDEAARTERLQHAQRLFIAMEATRHAERVAQELAR
jgi:class 3 adenylate cyclase/tetratricopeptide (TPR) repeat protein